VGEVLFEAFAGGDMGATLVRPLAECVGGCLADIAGAALGRAREAVVGRCGGARQSTGPEV
jgi:hypothetical protein